VIVNIAERMNEADFTERHYREILRHAAARYRFASFDEPPAERHVLWRHDVDASPHRALALARIEAEEGVLSTYCVNLHSEFYNLLEPSIVTRVREIVTLGHRLGLHLDPGFACPRDVEDLASMLQGERRVLQQTFEAAVNVFSIHDVDFHGLLRFDEDEVGGMVNAYGRRVFRDYHYVSDSNGHWRFQRLFDVVARSEAQRLHVLTHPEWWQADAMPPSQRIDRCITGRGRSVRSNYDRSLDKAGRPNIGAEEPAARAFSRRRVTVSEILAALPHAAPLGALALDAEVSAPARLSDAKPGTITFVGAGARAIPVDLAATMVLVDEQAAAKLDASSWSVAAAVSTPSARLDFIRTVARFFAPPRAAGVDASASIAEGASIADDVYVGPACTIAAGVEIGAGSSLHAGVHVYAGTRIGRNVTINAGAVIGCDGFGFARDERAQWVPFPHLGGVLIGDDVFIGANACIARGTLTDTTIESGAKIDNLVHIAHNVQVGRDAVVIGHAAVGGSAQIGARSWIAPGALVLDGLQIGDDAVIGQGAVVMRDIPAAAKVMGNPARELPPDPQRRGL
jgi:UDP-3-O-[3-hydroxymyristoyl] glucosamine N-acyltransferase